MDLDKEVFTTFEAADICHANISSIKNWIADGELDAFKTPGGHYRIPRDVLVDFLQRHEMPNPFAHRQTPRVLVVHPDGEFAEEFAESLGGDVEFDAADDGVGALLKIGQWKPDVAVVARRVDELDVAALCRRVEEFSDLSHVQMVVVGAEGGEEAFREAGGVEVVGGVEEAVEVVSGMLG